MVGGRNEGGGGRQKGRVKGNGRGGERREKEGRGIWVGDIE